MINLEKNTNLCCGDCLPLDDKKLWSQYKRIIKDNGAILLFCQGSFFVRLVNGNPKWFRYDLIWNKELVTGFLNATECLCGSTNKSQCSIKGFPHTIHNSAKELHCTVKEKHSFRKNRRIITMESTICQATIERGVLKSILRVSYHSKSRIRACLIIVPKNQLLC